MSTNNSLTPISVRPEDDAAAPTAFRPESRRWFVALREEGKSERTLACYGRDLEDTTEALTAILHRPVGCSDLALIGQDQVDAIVGLWTFAHASIPTVLRRFAALRGFARHLEVQEGIDCGRLLWAKLPKMIRSPKPALDVEAISVITADHAGAEGWIELRGRAIFALQASTAMTTAEIVALNRRQVFGRMGAISIEKTHLVPRIVAASTEAEDVIRRYLAALPFDVGPGDPLFLNARGGRLTARSVQVAFRQRGSELALPARSGPMTLRHAAGQSLADSGAAPATVAAALGVSIAAVGRYFV